MRTDFFAALLGAVVFSSTSAVAQTDTTFTYQGALNEAGAPANGSFNLEFTLFDALSGGAQVGSTITIAAQSVSDGVFSSQLDFGAQDFSGAQYWLEIVVDGTTLSPRQPMTASPFSIQTRGLFVDGNNNVGFGTDDPGSPVHAVTSNFLGRAIFGEATNTTNLSYGVYGSAASSIGYGVFGIATATVGDNNGGRFLSNSTSGSGVFGHANAITGGATGGTFQSNSTSGHGSYSAALAGSGVNYGVRGKTNSPSGFAGYFEGGKNYFEGRVGIGEDAPSDLLHVNAPAGVSAFRVQTDGSTRIRVNDLGGLSLGGNSSFVADGNTYVVNSLGIGDATPDEKLDVIGNGVISGRLTVGTGTPQATFSLAVAGTAAKTGGGSWAVFSDQRLKKNISSMSGSLDTISALRPVNFEYTAKDHFSFTPGVQSGFIAQEVQQVIPQWVNTADDGYFYLNQVGYEALIVDAIQELRAEKDAVQEEVNDLRLENELLNARLDRLEQMMVLLVDK